jgi:pimeloyl-ACP methyl ester carboxylesterase
VRFVLIPGGAHGAWCWGPVGEVLEANGHQAVAVELPGHGERRDEVPTMVGYREAVLDVLQPGDVIVAHSMGGWIATAAADAALDRVRHVVYLAAGTAVHGKSIHDSLVADDEAVSDGAVHLDEIGMEDYIDVLDTENGPYYQMRSFEAARQFFYHDCDPEVARWAYELLTPQAVNVQLETIEIPNFLAEPPPRSYIMCTDDRAVGAQHALMHMRRLGLQWCLPIHASHSAFLSRPADTAGLIVAASLGDAG